MNDQIAEIWAASLKWLAANYQWLSGTVLTAVVAYATLGTYKRQANAALPIIDGDAQETENHPGWIDIRLMIYNRSLSRLKVTSVACRSPRGLRVSDVGSVSCTDEYGGVAPSYDPEAMNDRGGIVELAERVPGRPRPHLVGRRKRPQARHDPRPPEGPP